MSGALAASAHEGNSMTSWGATPPGERPWSWLRTLLGLATTEQIRSLASHLYSLEARIRRLERPGEAPALPNSHVELPAPDARDARVLESTRMEVERLPPSKRTALEELRTRVDADAAAGAISRAELDVLKQWSICGDRDGTLMWYLEAGRWELSSAYQGLKDSLQWAVTERPRLLQLAADVSPEKRALYFSSWPVDFLGLDRKGEPIFLEYTGQIKAGAMSRAMSMDEMISLYVESMEVKRRYLFPRFSREAGRRIDRMGTICDLRGLGMAQASPACVSFIKQMAKVHALGYGGAHTGGIYFVHAPWVFNRLFGMVKGALSQQMQDSCNVLSRSEELLQLVDAEYLPGDLAGDAPKDGSSTRGGGAAHQQILRDLEEARLLLQDGKDPMDFMHVEETTPAPASPVKEISWPTAAEEPVASVPSMLEGTPLETSRKLERGAKEERPPQASIPNAGSLTPKTHKKPRAGKKALVSRIDMPPYPPRVRKKKSALQVDFSAGKETGKVSKILLAPALRILTLFLYRLAKILEFLALVLERHVQTKYGRDSTALLSAELRRRDCNFQGTLT
uniref:CRAL-TRIO domain-containing protein n=1 Tax=Pinguiococcus pyrenoidosus TaxID=172671 RepID=A0A7R9UEP8_9STRA